MTGYEMIRAIRGPIMLITVGTLFEVDHVTNYDFQQTWPIILIVAGVLALLGRANRPVSGGAS